MRKKMIVTNAEVHRGYGREQSWPIEGSAVALA
jgi:hypothetical protein